MRTCSLLIGLIVVALVIAIVMPRVHSHHSGEATSSPRWVKVDGKWVERGRRPRPVDVKVGEVPVETKAPEVENPKLPQGDIIDSKDNQGLVWFVTGSYQTSPDEAKQSALSLAQIKILSHYQEQGTPLEWLPPTNYIATRLVKKTTKEESDFDAAGKMYRAVLEVRLTPESQTEIVRCDREYRAQGRMWWLGKIVAGLVAVLAAVAGYFRLDEMTKGYYTTWLRVGAGFVGTAALLLMLA